MHGQYGSMLFLTKYEKKIDCTWFLLPLPLHYNGGDYWQDKTLWVKLKTNEGVIFLTLLLQKSEVFLLQISSENVNA